MSGTSIQLYVYLLFNNLFSIQQRPVSEQLGMVLLLDLFFWTAAEIVI